jgi:hypothetical protein
MRMAYQDELHSLEKTWIIGRHESMLADVLSFMIMASQLDAATILVATPVVMTTLEISEIVDQRDIDKSNDYAEESVMTRMMTSTLQYKSSHISTS